MPYQIIDHTADIGLKVRSRDFPGLLKDAAAGLYDLMTNPASLSQGAAPFTIQLQAGNAGDLFLKWLRELLFLFSTRRLAARQIEFQQISETALEARIRPAVLDPRIHEQRREVKAVTYHAFQIEKKAEGWAAQVILDI